MVNEKEITAAVNLYEFEVRWVLNGPFWTKNWARETAKMTEEQIDKLHDAMVKKFYHHNLSLTGAVNNSAFGGFVWLWHRKDGCMKLVAVDDDLRLYSKPGHIAITTHKDNIVQVGGRIAWLDAKNFTFTVDVSPIVSVAVIQNIIAIAYGLVEK